MWTYAEYATRITRAYPWPLKDSTWIFTFGRYGTIWHFSYFLFHTPQHTSELIPTELQTPGGERWYVASMDLAYSSSNPVFEHPDRPKLSVRLATKTNSPLFATPVGKAFNCDSKTVVMFAQDKTDVSGHLAKLYLRDLKMQSFMYKATNNWGPTFQCSATGTYRSETAPLTVGSILAVCCLGIVTAYGLWRWVVIITNYWELINWLMQFPQIFQSEEGAVRSNGLNQCGIDVWGS